MIVISRRERECIRIGDKIRVYVTEIDGTDRVRLAIDAPHDVPIRRNEAWDKAQRDDLKIAECDYED